MSQSRETLSKALSETIDQTRNSKDMLLCLYQSTGQKFFICFTIYVCVFLVCTFCLLYLSNIWDVKIVTWFCWWNYMHICTKRSFNSCLYIKIVLMYLYVAISRHILTSPQSINKDYQIHWLAVQKFKCR